MKDVILLALSVLPKEKRESVFIVEGADIQGKYIGQLEPVIQYMIMSGTACDIEIIALCTDTVRKDSENFSGMSALSFYQSRVEELAKEHGMGNKITVTPIDISESSPIEGISATASYIRNISDMHSLWIDTHGGFRDIALTLEAVISLLKVDNIYPDHIFGVRYDKNSAVLTDQTYSYDMFEFVSGMNEFIGSGSVSLLNRYYEKHHNEQLKPALMAMNTISTGAEECNPQMYIDGLNALGSSIDSIDGSDALLGIFADYIRKSYGVLLDQKKRTTVDIIRRCLDKELYQQALTFTETLMPSEFVDRKILYYQESEMDRIKKVFPKLKPLYETDKNFFINSYVTSSSGNPFFKSSKAIPVTLNEEKEYIEILNGKKSQYTVSTDFLDPMKVVKSKAINISRNPNEKVEFTFYTEVGANEWRKAGKLFKMHKALKRCRNAFNHCNPDRAAMKDIVAVLEQYIALSTELFEVYKS